jgi:hypothetical protein
MAKTNHQVTFNGKVVGIRKSDRIYTHAVAQNRHAAVVAGCPFLEGKAYMPLVCADVCK